MSADRGFASYSLQDRLVHPWNGQQMQPFLNGAPVGLSNQHLISPLAVDLQWLIELPHLINQGPPGTYGKSVMRV